MYEGLKRLEVPRTPAHPRARKAVRLTLIGLLLLSVFLGSTALFTYLKVKANIAKGQRAIANLVAATPKGPLNILVLGSDRRSVIEGKEKEERQFKGGSGQRADTIILMHLSAHVGQATLVSIPRDLRVEIPGHGHDKINSAYTYGGANLMIRTVSRLTGLDINHYVEVNFASFRSIVDSLGGVSLYFPKKVSDKKSGLHIDAGCQHLGGDQALAFVRTRSIYPTADIGRIQAQQRFIRALLAKVHGAGFYLNPPKIIALSAAIGKGLIYDKDVNLSVARAIANKLAGFDQRHVDFRIFPGTPQLLGGVSYVVPNTVQARRLFRAMREDKPLPGYGKTNQSLPDPADVSIRILNGTGRNGVARQEKSVLAKLGYHIEQIGSAATQRATTITYASGDDLKADLVAKLFPGAVIKAGSSGQVVDVILTLGTRFSAPKASSSAKPKPIATAIGSTCRA